VDALAGVQITEVDMADAGMTVIREEGLLSHRQIEWLEGLPKGERSVAVGRLSRDRAQENGPTLADAITQGIRRRVEAMLALNEVSEDRILSVKRDAVFVVGPPPGRLFLHGTTTRFRLKSSYTAFARLGRVELYGVPRRGTADLKGIPEHKRELHAEFCTRLALDVLGMVERGDRIEAAATLQLFRSDYIAHRLPVGFYREFNPESAFRVAAGRLRFTVEALGSDVPREQLDITLNVRNVISPLARFFA